MRRLLLGWGFLVVGLGGCSLDVDGDPEVGGAPLALTYSTTTSEFPSVGTLQYSRSGSQHRCSAVLVGLRTILTAAHCIEGASDFRFTLTANGRTYTGTNARVPSDYPRAETVTVDLGSGSVDLLVTFNDVGTLQLTTDPPTTVRRATISSEDPPMQGLDGNPYKLVGVTSSGTAKVTLHGAMALLRSNTAWFGSNSTSTGRGGVAETSDLGGPTFGYLEDRQLFGTNRLIAVIGVHGQVLPRATRVPFPITVDIRTDIVRSFIRSSSGDDVCVDGDHSDPTVACMGGDDPDQVCGDRKIEGSEECDDGDLSSGDGCSNQCQIETGYECYNEPSECRNTRNAECGDGFVDGSEECDDNNTRSGDGCDSRCREEVGWVCRFEPSICSTDEFGECGNEVIEGFEECDDGNQWSSDGCDSLCQREAGYVCSGTPSRCTMDESAFTVCGDGFTEGLEECDDGNRTPGDGCDFTCRRESPTTTVRCGDGIVVYPEQCDDRNTNNGDGCTSSCQVEVGWVCGRGQPSVCMRTATGTPAGACACRAAGLRSEGSGPFAALFMASLIAVPAVRRRRRGRAASRRRPGR